MHFYSLSLSEVNELPYEDFLKMHQAMQMIEARKILLGFKVSSFPNFAKSDKEKVHREFYKAAFPDAFVEKKKLTLKEIAMAMAGK